MMGGVTFNIAMPCVRDAVEIIRRDKLNLYVLAVGGVCSPERINAFFDARMRCSRRRPAPGILISRSAPSIATRRCDVK
jgi:hypothetical protein